MSDRGDDERDRSSEPNAAERDGGKPDAPPDVDRPGQQGGSGGRYGHGDREQQEQPGRAPPRERQERAPPGERERPATGPSDESADTEVLGERIAAELIDNTLLFVLYWGIAIVFGGLSVLASGASETLGSGGFLVTIFLAPLSLFLYNFVLEGWWNGQTIGKRLVGLQVVRKDGSPISPLQAGVRAVPIFVAVLGTIGAFLFAFQLAVGLVVMAVTDENQRLFDMLAGTVVVDEDAV